MNRKFLRLVALPILCLGLAQCTSNNTTEDTQATAFAVLRLTANGAADTTFGAPKGIVVTDIDPPAFDFAMAVAIQPVDNKIVVGGSDGLGGQGLTALVRYNADGTLDTTGFGTNGTGGIVRTTLPSPASATALAIQGDGKIVAAALTFAPMTSMTGITLIRYNTNGTLDTAGFGTSGIAAPAAIGRGLAGDTCALLAQGAKFVVAGGSQDGNIVLYRYDSAGALDQTFGTNGKTVTSLGAATVAMSPAMAAQSDGRIILVTGNSNDQVVLRYSADGVLDTTFGGAPGGIVTTDVGGSVNFANAVAVQPASMGDPSNTDKIIVSGHALGNASDITLIRYNANGTLDPTFNATGIVRTDLGATDNVFTVALQPQPAAEPKILVSGNFGANGVAQTIVLRYNASGTLDTGFGNQGLLLVPLFGPSTIASGNAMVLQPVSAGLGIVVAGYD
jgi:uncharacterized delta-60 repeat protein